MGLSDLHRKPAAHATDGQHVGGRTRLPAHLLHGARELSPGYFAFVMATGIVSIACQLLDLHRIAVTLLAISWAGYLALWALTVVRIARFPGRMLSDLSDHRRGPGFFTVVAGTCVLGTQTAVVAAAPAIGADLWYLGLGLWAVVMYAFFTAVTIREEKPSLAEGINGVWLVGAVATQSIVVLGGALGAAVPPAGGVQLLCLAFFMIGCMLYLAIIPLICLRLTFGRFAPAEFNPAYWINMGAAAISTLAGAILVARSGSWAVLTEFRPMLEGLTIFFWSAASWWIPFLAVLMLWRYLVRRDPLRYDPQLWGMVFPLGMYTAASLETGRALHLPMLLPIARVGVCVALIAWLATFAGMVVHLVRVATAAPEGG